MVVWTGLDEQVRLDYLKRICGKDHIAGCGENFYERAQTKKRLRIEFTDDRPAQADLSVRNSEYWRTTKACPLNSLKKPPMGADASRILAILAPKKSDPTR